MAKKKEAERYVFHQGYIPPRDEPARPAAKRQRAARPFPWKVILIAALAVAVCAAGVIFVPRLFNAAAPVSWSGADLVGDWVATADGEAAFQATVGSSSIRIDWDSNDHQTRALYWEGTFSVPAGPEKTKTVVSAAASSLQTALLASQDPQKTFTVTRDGITFDAGALGVTRTFTLRRR